MNFIKQEMLEKGADGVVFHPICHPDCDIFKIVHCEYSLDEIDSINAVPKSARSYYKIIDGKKILLRENTAREESL